MRHYKIPTKNIKDKDNNILPWDTFAVQKATQNKIDKSSLRAAERLIEKENILPNPVAYDRVFDEKNNLIKLNILQTLVTNAKKKRNLIYIVQLKKINKELFVLFLNDGRLGRKWFWIEKKNLSSLFIKKCIKALLESVKKNILFIPCGEITKYFKEIYTPNINQIIISHKIFFGLFPSSAYRQYLYENNLQQIIIKKRISSSHLDNLENESIHIIREVIAES